MGGDGRPNGKSSQAAKDLSHRVAPIAKRLYRDVRAIIARGDQDIARLTLTPETVVEASSKFITVVETCIADVRAAIGRAVYAVECQHGERVAAAVKAQAEAAIAPLVAELDTKIELFRRSGGTFRQA